MTDGAQADQLDRSRHLPTTSDFRPTVAANPQAPLPEVGPTGQMTIEVDVVVDGSANGNEYPKRDTASEMLHGSLSSSERLMGIFRPVVQPSRSVMAASDAEARECRAAGT